MRIKITFTGPNTDLRKKEAVIGCNRGITLAQLKKVCKEFFPEQKDDFLTLTTEKDDQ